MPSDVDSSICTSVLLICVGTCGVMSFVQRFYAVQMTVLDAVRVPSFEHRGQTAVSGDNLNDRTWRGFFIWRRNTISLKASCKVVLIAPSEGRHGRDQPRRPYRANADERPKHRRCDAGVPAGCVLLLILVRAASALLSAWYESPNQIHS